MTPMRASIVGPFWLTTRSRASTASCPFLDLLFGLRQLLDISGGIFESDKLATARQQDRIVEGPLPTLVRHLRGYRRLHRSDPNDCLYATI
jgi:hypothetical protein